MLDQNPMTFLLEASKCESFEHFRDHMEQSMLFRNKKQQRLYHVRSAIKNGIEGGLYVEFGVAKGDGCRTFGEVLGEHYLTLTGFGSFEGLEEDWTGMHTGRQAGALSTKGKLPEVPDNVAFEEGWVQDTLPGYFKANGKAPFAFIHMGMDMDTYTPTAYAVAAVKSRLRKGTVILFDELYGYPGWRYHEYKALTETLSEGDYQYISFSAEAVGIEMLRTPKK